MGPSERARMVRGSTFTETYPDSLSGERSDHEDCRFCGSNIVRYCQFHTIQLIHGVTLTKLKKLFITKCKIQLFNLLSSLLPPSSPFLFFLSPHSVRPPPLFFRSSPCLPSFSFHFKLYLVSGVRTPLEVQ